MKEQIEELKRQWLSDPSWDIEDTDGFEAHRQELYVFRLETENKQLREQVEKLNSFRHLCREFFGGAQ